MPRVAVLFHESERLGAGISVLRVVPHLADRGWVVSGWFPGPGPLVIGSADALAEQGVSWKPIAFSARGWRAAPGVATRLRRTPRYLRAFRAWLEETRPDVVHANSLQMLPEATMARRLGLPVVLQLHELRSPGVKRAATLRWASAVSDVLVGVSDAVSAMLRSRSGRTPVVTVRNGVPVSPMIVRPNDDSVVVGTVGYVSRVKGTDIFLHAAELVLRQRPGVRFEHAGAPRLWGDDVFDDDVDDLAASPVLRASLTWLGSTNVEQALAGWQIFVLASRQEAFPLSTLEAMAAGLPVIATDVGGIPEQISHLETGVLVAPASPSALAEWIVRLIDDPGLRRRLGDSARRVAAEKFTLGRQADGLHAVYELAHRRRSTRQGLLRIERSLS